MKRLLIALCLLPCLLGMRAPTFAAAYSASLGSGTTAGTSSVAIVTSGHVAGQPIVLAFATDNSLSGGISSIADTGGNSYSSSTVANVSGRRTEIWVTNGAAAAGTITITRIGATGNAVACAVSYTGMSLTKESGNTANSTTGSAAVTWTVVGSGTMSVAALGYIYTANDLNATPPSGWNVRYNLKVAAVSLELAYYDTSGAPLSPGSNTITETWTIGGHAWTMIAQSFSAGSAAGKASLVPMTGAGL